MRATTAVGIGLVLACVGPLALAQSDRAGADEEPGEPLELGLEEAVDVRLVLVDFLVLDRRNRTVPDLTRDDLYLLVNGREKEIASLDVDCPIGAAEDPLPGPKGRPLPSVPTERPPRIVLVFDYFHMANTAETFDEVIRGLDKWPSGGEEHMVISLGQVIRIESPFTSDPQQIRWTLQRMRNDPELYAGNYSRLTERRFFERIRTLFDLLEMWPGRKAVVLFSGPFLPDGFYHDPEYKQLSALATTVRASIYPVDTGGLRVPTDPLYSPLGGPPGLRRLANETGGRMTADTNEIGLAYAKAHRDGSCSYTLGFYDDRARLDDERRLTIRVKDRGGLRIVYPEFYVIRSPEKKRRSLFRTAAMAPQMFDSDELSTDLFVLAPRSAERWSALLAVEIRLGPDAFILEDETWRLRVLVRKPNGTVVHSFKRTVPLPASDPGGAPNPVVTLFEELRVRPGRYLVSAVLSDPDAETPRTATRPAVVSEIPRHKPFLIGPILGHRSGDAEDDAPSGRTRSTRPVFEPLMVQQAEQGQTLDSLTVVCVVDPERPVELRELARQVTSWEGEESVRFDPVSARLAGEDRLECHHQFDRVATARLSPGRYELTATAETTEFVAGTGSVEFTVSAVAE